ncbi:MAG TPA: hypothetical protein VMW35_22335 [Myxococcota bacterium]|nr:hypothetical protein [Myxococcota bacterium]
MTTEPDRQDIYSSYSITWHWVLVGAIVVLGVATLVGSSLAAFGMNLESNLVPFVASTLVAFLIGGVIIGWLSPGYTMWEAGLASVAAAIWLVFLAIRLLHFDTMFLYTLPIGLLLGLGAGLLGGRIGEMLQK